MNQLLKCSACGSLSMVSAGQKPTCPKCGAPMAGSQPSTPPLGQPKPASSPAPSPSSASSASRSSLAKPGTAPSASAKAPAASAKLSGAPTAKLSGAPSASAKAPAGQAPAASAKTPTAKAPTVASQPKPAAKSAGPKAAAMPVPELVEDDPSPVPELVEDDPAPVPARVHEDLDLKLADEPPGMEAMMELGAAPAAAPVITRRTPIRSEPIEDSGRPLGTKIAIAAAAVLLLGGLGGVGYFVYNSVITVVDPTGQTDYDRPTWAKYESTSGWFTVEGPGVFRTNRGTPLRKLASDDDAELLVGEECELPSHKSSFMVLYRGVDKTFTSPGDEGLLLVAAMKLGGKLSQPRPVQLKTEPPLSGLEAEVDGPDGRVILLALHSGLDLWYVLAVRGAGIEDRKHSAVERFVNSFAPSIPSVAVLAVQLSENDTAAHSIGIRLSHFGDKAIPTLKDFLTDGRTEVGKRSIEFLDRDEPWMPSVWDAALDSPHPEVRGEMLKLLLKRATKGDTTAAGRLAAAVSHAQPDVRATALDMVLRRAKFPADVQANALKATLGDADPKVVAQAVEVCLSMVSKQPQALPPIASLAAVAKRTDLAPAVRTKLVDVLTGAGASNAIVLETLLAGARDSVPEYRLASIRGLGRMAPKTAETKAVPALVAVMEAAAREGKSGVPFGQAAAESLLILGNTGIEAVQKSLAHKSEAVRGFALEALSHPPSGGTVSGADVLSDLSNSQDPQIRRAVVVGMGRLLPEFPLLADRLTELVTSDSDEEVRLNAAVSLLAVSRADTISNCLKSVATATEDRAPAVRQAALKWLARHAGDSAPAADAMVRRLADADAAVRAVAAEAVLAGREDAARVAALEPPLSAGLKQTDPIGRVQTAVVALKFAVVLARPDPILPDRIRALLSAAAPIVHDAFDGKQPAPVRAIARGGLGAAVNQLPDALVTPLVQRLLTSSDPADAAALASVLEALLADPMRSRTAMSAVVRAFVAGNLPEATAMKLIASSADPTRAAQARQTTASELSNLLAAPGAAKDGAARRRVLLLMGQMHDAAAPFVSQVTAVLKNRTGEAAEARVAAAVCLGHLRSHAVGALPDLLACQSATTEQDAAVRAAATAAIKEIREATGMTGN